jgi:hypothetical protein
VQGRTMHLCYFFGWYIGHLGVGSIDGVLGRSLGCSRVDMLCDWASQCGPGCSQGALGSLLGSLEQSWLRQWQLMGH